MQIHDAQREMRRHFVGGFYGQLTAGVLWLVAAALATWGTPRVAIMWLVIGGMFIFPVTTLLLRLSGTPRALSPANTLVQLGAQVAFVLPLSMPLLLPVARYRLEWFFPAMMVLLGAHYLPFTFLYGMAMFAVLCAALVGAGVGLAMMGAGGFAGGAWVAALLLLAFAIVGREAAMRE
jgi:hypothetical protein